MRASNLSKLSLALAFFSLTSVVQAQTIAEDQAPQQSPPINMEVMAGSRGVYYQVMVNKKFRSIPKLGFFSVTNGNAPWEKEMTPDIMTQSHLTYTLFKGLDITGGLQYTPVYGFRPVAGLIYSYATPELLIVANPKIDLASDWASENMALVEYRPRINENWSWYGRVQGLYGFVPRSGDHNRSYIYLRAGVGYKEFSFGVGSNFEWYGPMKHNENSVGLFANVLIF
ncbi:hypothetical protein [Epilithonimonas hungarica]|uniref:Outer membrane protein beta-barrel domain-containing protein n=1 Tax=Epilithonimonas hungarica TaxID=454006 RepID=A0A1G7SSH5_9FLAO|nr:hypothetical protein [Epilithonimonas hungarica]SDG25724.1 hypothetical protein SAMN05421825_3060 [Epilithonimonas hungarica]